MWWLTVMSCGLCLGLVSPVTALNMRPIIGVLAQSSDPEQKYLGDSYIPANYIKYIESAGARVVPVRIREGEDYYKKMFKAINGILFPGGGVSLTNSSFAKEGKLLYNMAIQAFDAGDYFPVWGTCQGFELLATITANRDVMSTYDAEDLPLPLNFTKDFAKSRLFGSLPQDVYHYLLTKNVTENFHQLGLSPETYRKNSNLKSFYKVLSTNNDRNGKEFVSTMEANKYPIYATQWHPEVNMLNWNLKHHINHTASAVRVAQHFANFLVAEAYKYPIYATQWHPEKTMFTWSLQSHVMHDAAAVRVSQHFANFLVAEARKSNHHFDSLEDELGALIYNYNPVFFKDESFTQNYYFNFTKEH